VIKRRTFLGALLGLAAAPVIARLLPLYVPPETPPLLLPTLDVDDFESLIGIAAYGTGTINAAGLIRILRADGDQIFDLGMNKNGGVIFWQSGPNHINAPIFNKTFPMIVESGVDIDLTVTCRSKNGNCSSHRYINGLLVSMSSHK
jgi:hypothetical protein